MDQPIYRDGAWWLQSATGWLRYDDSAGAWQTSAAIPPPPPAPAPAAVASASATSRFQSPLAPVVEPPDRRSRTLMAAAAGVVAVLLLAGFGAYTLRDEDTAPASTVTPPADTAPAVSEKPDPATARRAAFIMTADELCARINADVRAVPQPDTEQGLVDYTQRVKAIMVSGLHDLQALKPPAKEAGAWRRNLGLIDKALVQADVAISAIQRQDGRAYARAGVRSTRLINKFNQWATAYGFQECNQPS